MDNTDSMPPIIMQAIGSARLKHIQRNQIILYEGDLPSDVYILKHGVVKIYDVDKLGNEKILHLVKPPALIPFAFFSGIDTPLQWLYATLTDCDVYVFSAAELTEKVKKNGELGHILTCGFSSDVHELLVRLSGLEKTNSKDKIVSILKFLAVCHSTERSSGWRRVNFSVNHQLLADLAGLTRESTAIVMKSLKREKVVRNPRLTILEIDFQKLIKK